MPVVVISRGIATSSVGPGDDGAHVVAESSGHDVHVKLPLVVVTAIRRLVEHVRRERKALTPL